MKRIGFLPFILMLVLLAGCAGGNQVATTGTAQLAPAPSLVLSDEGSIGGGNGFALVPRFDAATGRLTAEVRAPEAVELKAALLSVSFPAADYHLVQGEYTGGLGSTDDVISLVKQSGDKVYLGAALIDYAQRIGVSGDLPLFRLEFAPGAGTQAGADGKGVAKAPAAPANAVSLSGNIDAENMVHLSWTELNKGDGNNDGIVNISDLTPLAANFNETARPEDPASLLADYNSDTAVSILDLTVLAAFFGTDLDGYNVEYKESGAADWTRIPPQGAGDVTLLRGDLFDSPGASDGPLEWSFDYGPIEGTFTFRVVAHSTTGEDGAVSANTITLTGIVEFEEVRINLPGEDNDFMVITEEAIDEVEGNEQPFADASIQLTAEGRQPEHEEWQDGTNRVEWRIIGGTASATVGNTPGVDKGLVQATDVGSVIVLAYDPGNLAAADTVEIPIYAISSLELKVEGQEAPSDVSVAKGDTVDLVVTGTFDDNDGDTGDTKEFDLTPYAGWILERPLVDEGPPPVYEAGSFIIDAQTGELYTLASDSDLESGFSVAVSVTFPPEGVDATIGGGYRAQSNTITITLE